MARLTIAIALVALLAISFAADVSASYCRVSSYKVPVDTIVKQKMALYAACGANVKIISQTAGDMNKAQPGCSQIKQQVADEAAWKAYSDCEKSAKNAALYKPLSGNGQRSDCSASQSMGPC